MPHSPNSDLRTGWQLGVTLDPRTPLAWLERFNETIPNCAPENLPPVMMQFGFWTPVLKTWKELGIPLKEFSPGLRVSWIGPVTRDGGIALPFLKEYRGVIEGTGSVLERCDEVAQLLMRPQYQEIASKCGPHFTTSWAVCALDDALPVGPTLARRLFDAGFHDVSAVQAASDDSLLAVRGLGRKKLDEIRSSIGRDGEPRFQ